MPIKELLNITLAPRVCPAYLTGVASHNGAAGSRGPLSSSVGRLARAPSVPIHPEPWSPAPGANAFRSPHAHSHASPFPFTHSPSMPRVGPIPATSSAPLNGARPTSPGAIDVAVGPADAAHAVRHSTSGAVGASGAVAGVGGAASGQGSLMSRLRDGLALHFRRSGSNRVHLHSSSAPSSPPLGAVVPTGQHQQHHQHQPNPHYQQTDLPDAHESQLAVYNNALLLSSSHVVQPHSSTHSQLPAFSDPAAHTLTGGRSSRSLLTLPTQLSLPSSHSQVLTPADVQPAAAAASAHQQPAPPALTQALMHTRSSSETTALAAHQPYEPFDPLLPGPELSLSGPEAPGHTAMGSVGRHTGVLPELTNSGAADHIRAGGGSSNAGGGALSAEDAAGASTSPPVPAALTAAVEPLAAAARAVREAAAAAAETLTQRQAAVQRGTWLGVRLANGVAASAIPPHGALPPPSASAAHAEAATGGAAAPGEGVAAAAAMTVSRSARHSSAGSVPAGPRRSATASLQEVILKAEVALGGQLGAAGGMGHGAGARGSARISAGEGEAGEWGGGTGGSGGSRGGE